MSYSQSVVSCHAEVTHHSGDGGSKYLWNISKLLPDYTALQPRRQPYSILISPWTSLLMQLMKQKSWSILHLHRVIVYQKNVMMTTGLNMLLWYCNINNTWLVVYIEKHTVGIDRQYIHNWMLVCKVLYLCFKLQVLLRHFQWILKAKSMNCKNWRR
jgi:hypothetical protein